MGIPDEFRGKEPLYQSDSLRDVLDVAITDHHYRVVGIGIHRDSMIKGQGEILMENEIFIEEK